MNRYMMAHLNNTETMGKILGIPHSNAVALMAKYEQEGGVIKIVGFLDQKVVVTQEFVIRQYERIIQGHPEVPNYYSDKEVGCRFAKLVLTYPQEFEECVTKAYILSFRPKPVPFEYTFEEMIEDAIAGFILHAFTECEDELDT